MTMLVIQSTSFKDIFHFVGSEVQIDLKKAWQIKALLEDAIIKLLNERIYSVGIDVSNFTLADIDFNKLAAEALEQKQIAPMLAEAQVLAYDELFKIGQKLSLDTTAAEFTLRTELIQALKKAAGSGILGATLEGTALEKFLPVSEIPESASKVIVVN